MLRSMTAFARHEQADTSGTITWELRSVNHRYLEISLRLPEALRSLENLMRERITSKLSRGKLEGTLKLQNLSAGLSAININQAVVERLLAVAKELEQKIGASSGLKLIDVLRWPGVVAESELDLEGMQTALFSALDAALEELIATREREGQRTAELLGQRIVAMREQVRRVRARRPQVLEYWRDKLLTRISEIPVEAEPGRLEQELVLIAHRLDVDEELDRLDTHLNEMQSVLRRPEPVGRRLDFLMQELNREANTLSSKAADSETTQASLEMKVLIEQMREQVQNVE